MGCYTPRLTAPTERSRSGTATERARDGASRAGPSGRTSLASRARGARYRAQRQPRTGARDVRPAQGLRTSRWYHDPVRPLDERGFESPRRSSFQDRGMTDTKTATTKMTELPKA